jgi:ubiquinone/menaquinone biosynthesis C-methylase UbiE
VGCGPGVVAEVLVKRFAHVIGTDMNPRQIELAVQRLKQQQVDESEGAPRNESTKTCSLGESKIAFRQAPAEKIEWLASASIDLVTAATAVYCTYGSKGHQS